MIKRWKEIFHCLIDERAHSISIQMDAIRSQQYCTFSNLVLDRLVCLFSNIYNLIWNIWNSKTSLSLFSVHDFVLGSNRPNVLRVTITTNKNHIIYTKLPITSSAMKLIAFFRCSFYRIESNYVNWSELEIIECDGCPIEHRENSNCHAQNIKIAMGN